MTLIEEKKKTTEYEGYLKDVGPTGNLEMDGVTCIG